jgi:hypothetical protein
VKATQLVRRRIEYADNKFAEIVVWKIERPVPESAHLYKYRLAYVVDEECILRYDTKPEKAIINMWTVKKSIMILCQSKFYCLISKAKSGG